MTFKDSLKNCLTVKYCNVQGRASRSEYWWFLLFSSVATTVLKNIPVVGMLASLTLILPAVCVTSRRLHDIGWSGWWQLFPLALFIAAVSSFFVDASGMTFAVLFLGGLGFALYFGLRKGTAPGEPNPYGGAPDSFAIPPRPAKPVPMEEFTVEEEPDVLCPNCGKAFGPDDRFCAQCGHAFPSVPRCPSCGKELPETANFCSKCGAKLKD
ncbi:MAG: DUF805 domain-containing protein [Mailhella sp.]|nr:DUF805 domain-containing protein [Mailhella sp.]